MESRKVLLGLWDFMSDKQLQQFRVFLKKKTTILSKGDLMADKLCGEKSIEIPFAWNSNHAPGFSHLPGL